MPKFLAHTRTAWTVCALAGFAAGSTAVSAGETAAAAFIQPDQVTRKVPTGAYFVSRGNEHVGSPATLQPCDTVTFNPGQKAVKQVRITTTRGGKDLLVNDQRMSVQVSCEPVGVGEVFIRLWRDLSGGERAAETRAAVTRSASCAAPTLPIFAADRSLIVAGRRSLYLTWAGGRPPYRVVLRRGADGRVLADLDNLHAPSVRLPDLDLAAGQYTLSVLVPPQDGCQPGMEEPNLFAVDAAELPPVPALLREAKLTRAEAQLAYVYYLEGLGDSRWAFEAMQHAAAISPATPAVTGWLRSYSEEAR